VSDKYKCEVCGLVTRCEHRIIAELQQQLSASEARVKELEAGRLKDIRRGEHLRDLLHSIAKATEATISTDEADIAASILERWKEVCAALAEASASWEEETLQGIDVRAELARLCELRDACVKMEALRASGGHPIAINVAIDCYLAALAACSEAQPPQAVAGGTT